MEIIIVSLKWLRSKYTVQNDNFHVLLCYDCLKEDLSSYLLIFSIIVFAVEKLDHGIV